MLRRTLPLLIGLTLVACTSSPMVDDRSPYAGAPQPPAPPAAPAAPGTALLADEGSVRAASPAEALRGESAPAAAAKGSAAAAQPSRDTSVTVYNQNLGLVRQLRRIEVQQGENQLAYDAVASGINASSVLFHDRTDPAARVVVQQYEYDLVSESALLERYLGKQLSLVYPGENQRGERLTGTLLAKDDGLLLQTDRGVVSVRDATQVEFPQLEGGLRTKPTLLWTLDATKGGRHEVETSYLTSGLSWQADYVAKVADDDRSLDLQGWVTLSNTSGAAYDDATLRLVAGEVNRVSSPAPMGMPSPKAETLDYGRGGGGFEEKSFFEYHLYRLTRPVTLSQNQDSQLLLLSADAVPVTKKFIYDTYGDGKVQVVLALRNDEASHMGMPLPLGTVRIYKDDGGDAQFLGEDRIDHTPKDEELRVTVGKAFDVVVERVVESSARQGELLSFGTNCQQDTVATTVRNHKEKDAITVELLEHPSGVRTLVESRDMKVDKKSVSEFHVLVPVEAGKEATAHYTVRSCW